MTELNRQSGEKEERIIEIEIERLRPFKEHPFQVKDGKCAVTGIPMDSHDIHCHHKVPVSNGGSDEYANLILVSKAVYFSNLTAYQIHAPAHR